MNKKAPTIYCRIKGRDVWHWHPECHHVKASMNFAVSHVYIRSTKPRSGEFCNECIAKMKADKRRTRKPTAGQRLIEAAKEAAVMARQHKVSPEGMAWATREAKKILRLTPEQNAEIIAKSKPFSELRKAVHAKLRAAAKRKGK